MIEIRQSNIPILSGSTVPVKEICDHIAEQKSIEYLLKRYPISAEDVFECLTMVTNQTEICEDKDFILFEREKQTLSFGIKAITDLAMYNLIVFGRANHPEIEDFDQLLTKAVVQILEECLADIESEELAYKSIPLHVLVFNSLSDYLANNEVETDLLEMLRKITSQVHEFPEEATEQDLDDLTDDWRDLIDLNTAGDENEPGNTI